MYSKKCDLYNKQNVHKKIVFPVEDLEYSYSVQNVKTASGKAFVSQLKLTTCEDKGCHLFPGTNKAWESVWLTEESSSDTLGTSPLLSSFKSGPSSPGVFPNRPPPCSKNAGSSTQRIQWFWQQLSEWNFHQPAVTLWRNTMDLPKCKSIRLSLYG